MGQLGIDIGSLYLGAVSIEEGNLTHAEYRPHGGDITGAVSAVLEDPRFAEFDSVGITGKIPGKEGMAINNTLCLVEGGTFLAPGSRNIFAIGGETFSLILFDESGEYIEHSVNPPCASGTGAFIEQQAERLGYTVQELALEAASFGEKTPVIATRCAVFAKTDIIHAMQEGYSKQAVAAGLCEGIGRSIVDNLVKGRDLFPPVAVIGGVSKNRKVVDTVREILRMEVLVPAHSEVAGAAGAALLGDMKKVPKGFFEAGSTLERERRPRLSPSRGSKQQADQSPRGAWEQGGNKTADFNRFVRGEVEVMLPLQAPDIGEGVRIGIDIGSTSTKAVVLDGENRFAGGFYTATRGEPVEAVKRCMKVMKGSLPLDGVRLLSTGTTGSGRKLIQKLLQADLAVNEITAHAKAAVFLDPEVDTILEIGGQDSKFTRLRDGEVYFSTMNYVCAAGTGSFIEEQAKRLGVELSDFSDMAFRAEPPYTSDRCTVYMERDLHALLGEGWSREALAAAVLNSVRDNYIAKVVGRSPLGDHIVFQGATGRNRALISSFEELLDKPLVVSPFCHLTGALGAALLSTNAADGDSNFDWAAEEIQVREEVCTRCANRCLLTVIDRDGESIGWGMRCGKEYSERGPVGTQPGIVEKRFAEVMKPLDVPNPDRESARAAIGVPAVLYNAEYAPLWLRFLRTLGFHTVELKNSGGAVADGKRIINSDFCAPIIHAHGVFARFLRTGTDRIFYPAVINEASAEQKEHRFKKKTTDSYFCYYSQYLPSILSKLTAEDFESTLISPLLSFNSQSTEEIADELFESLHEEFPSVTREEVLSAFSESYRLFQEQRSAWSELYGLHQLEHPAEKGGGDSDRGAEVEIALTGRPYIALDPSLNLRIPEKIEALGARVFWQEEFSPPNHEGAYAKKYLDRMHWHYGKQILKLTEYAARRENLFLVYITSFRCSPDSFLLSYVQDIMEHYGKPFLILQVDEHSSDVGYETRIEAGVTSFRNYLAKRQGVKASTETPAGEERPTAAKDDQLSPGDTVLIPYLDECISSFWAACFRKAGYGTVLLESREADLMTGYQYTNGGECMPLVSLIGSVIRRVQDSALSPETTFFYMPTTCLACNFPQFPILADLAFKRAGMGDVKIGLINNMAPGEILPQSLTIRMLESNIIGGILYKLYHRIRPYEEIGGETDAVFEEGVRRIENAILAEEDLRSTLTEVIESFRRIRRNESGGRKPRIGLLGDLYVKFNSLINQDVQKTVDELGGELIVPSLTEYPFHFYDADIRLYGDNPRPFKLLRTIEQRYEKLADDLIGDQREPDFSECVELMEEYRIRHYIAGETSINIGRALYYIKHEQVEAILHLNPIFCCPGVVTSSVYRKIQEDFGVPIIDIFYDGTGDRNEVLIPHLHYLQKRCNVTHGSKS
jgi:predicted CoA-substrate-specific enzyme activase